MLGVPKFDTCYGDRITDTLCVSPLDQHELTAFLARVGCPTSSDLSNRPPRYQIAMGSLRSSSGAAWSGAPAVPNTANSSCVRVAAEYAVACLCLLTFGNVPENHLALLRAYVALMGLIIDPEYLRDVIRLVQRFEALIVQLRNCSDVKGGAAGHGYTAAVDGLDDTFVDLNATVVRFHFENESFIRSVLDV